jgi:hypothetical protein
MDPERGGPRSGRRRDGEALIAGVPMPSGEALLRNPLKDLLARGEIAASMTVRLVADPSIALLARSAGFDTIYVDLEHGPFGIETAARLCVAAQQAGLAPLVRVPSHGGEWIARVLDGGAMGVIVPHVDTPDEARAVVAAAKYPPFTSDKPKTCPNMFARIKGDNANIMIGKFKEKCPKGFSKIALVIDQSDDYHFLRQDNGGYWSQKSGARPVTNLDANDHKIWDPQLCDLNFSRKEGVLDYDVFCGYMCVPREKPLFMRISGGGSSSRAGPASSRARPFRTARTRGRS